MIAKVFSKGAVGWFQKAFVCFFMAAMFGLYLTNVAWATSTVDLTGVSLDTASVLSLAAIVLAAIGAIWGIKKLS